MTPYSKLLNKYKGMRNFLTIHRAEASDIYGQVLEVNELGCTIKAKSSVPGNMLVIFVAWEHIRGVAMEALNVDMH